MPSIPPAAAIAFTIVSTFMIPGVSSCAYSGATVSGILCAILSKIFIPDIGVGSFLNRDLDINVVAGTVADCVVAGVVDGGVVVVGVVVVVDVGVVVVVVVDVILVAVVVTDVAVAVDGVFVDGSGQLFGVVVSVYHWCCETETAQCSSKGTVSTGGFGKRGGRGV